MELEEVEFADSAFRRGYEPEDFFELIAGPVLKTRSKRGLAGIYELYGRNSAGDYLHVAYRKLPGKVVVFNMMRMTPREKQMFRRLV